MGKLNAMFFYGDKLNSGQYDNGVWMDILKVPFFEKIDQAEPYDVILRTLWLESVGWSKEIKTRWPQKTLIGLIDHPLSTHVSKMPPQQQVEFIADLEYLDGIMTLTEEERQWYQTAVPSKPVVKAGLPFPFEAYTEKYGALINSPKKYIGLGVGAADNDRNFITSFIIFQRLKLEFPELQGVFMSIPDNLLHRIVPLCDAAPDLYIHEREGMGQFYDVLSQCQFVINMADRNTPGRLQGEAAFFGVPVIGSNRLELQNELFPSLAVSPFEAQKAYENAKGLLTNPDSKLIIYAQKKLQRYNYKNSRKIFFNLLEEIEQRRG